MRVARGVRGRVENGRAGERRRRGGDRRVRLRLRPASFLRQRDAEEIFSTAIGGAGGRVRAAFVFALEKLEGRLLRDFEEERSAFEKRRRRALVYRVERRV